MTEHEALIEVAGRAKSLVQAAKDVCDDTGQPWEPEDCWCRECINQMWTALEALEAIRKAQGTTKETS